MCAYIPSFTYPNPIYQPAMRVIAAITNGFNPTVTTTVDHLYQVGMILRFDIPVGLGMQQLNQQVGTILTIPSPTTFTITANTTNYDPFVPPSAFPPPYQDAQVIEIGVENTNSVTAAVQNVLPFSATTP
jgi:hypothetical protein